MRSSRCYNGGCLLSTSFLFATSYASFADGCASLINVAAHRNGVETVWSAAGLLENFIIKIEDAPGIGSAWNFVLQINDVDTLCAFSIADTAVEGRYTATSITVAKHDRLKWKITYTGSPGDTSIAWTNYEFVGSVSKLSCYSGVSEHPQIGPGDESVYSGVFDVVQDFREEELTKNVSPLAGNLVILSVCLTNISGLIFDTTYIGDIVIVKNGIEQDGGGGTIDTKIDIDTGPTAVGDQITYDIEFTLPIIRGDDLSVHINRTDENPGVFAFTYSISLVAAIDGESVYCGTYGGTLDTGSDANYGKFADPDDLGYASFDNISSNQLGGVTSFLLGKWIVELTTAPGSGNTWTWTTRRNQEDTTLVMEATGVAVSAEDIVHGVAIADRDQFCFQIAPTSGPAQSRMRYGIVQMIEVTPPPDSPTGIFTPTPGQHRDEFNDANVRAIPTPYFVTALFGK